MAIGQSFYCLNGNLRILEKVFSCFFEKNFTGNGWENAIFKQKWPKKGIFLKNHFSLLVVKTVTLKYALSRFLSVLGCAIWISLIVCFST